MAENKKLKLPVLDFEGKEVEQVELPEELFGVEINEYLVSMAVRIDLANRRVSTAKTLDRAEVHGSNRKPYGQKHTGRARAGTTNSPIWRHGGVVHGPDGKQSYKLKMNKRDHQIALCSALTDKVQSNNVILIDENSFKGSKTKDFAKALKNIGADEKKNLIVFYNPEENVIRACRNIASIKAVYADNASVYDILNANKLILAKEVVKCECDCEECNHNHDKESK